MTFANPEGYWYQAQLENHSSVAFDMGYKKHDHHVFILCTIIEQCYVNYLHN